MKNTINYFSTIDEAMAFIEKNNIPAERVLDRGMNEWGDYFRPFAKIEGCRVLIYLVQGDRWNELNYCVEWNGTYMTNCAFICQEGTTHELRLVEDFDNKGIVVDEPYYEMRPNKIGTPTAKKLTDWAEYLTEKRRRAENERDRIIASIPAKIQECIQQFPEAASVEWDNGYWIFTKTLNGIEYTIEINSNGHIHETIHHNTHDYNIPLAEQAARLMQNGLRFCQC